MHESSIDDVAVHVVSRTCAGRAFAQASLYAFIVTILATCTISKAKDEHGNDIEPKFKFLQSTLRWVLGFTY